MVKLKNYDFEIDNTFDLYTVSANKIRYITAEQANVAGEIICVLPFIVTATGDYTAATVSPAEGDATYFSILSNIPQDVGIKAIWIKRKKYN